MLECRFNKTTQHVIIISWMKLKSDADAGSKIRSVMIGNDKTANLTDN